VGDASEKLQAAVADEWRSLAQTRARLASDAAMQVATARQRAKMAAQASEAGTGADPSGIRARKGQPIVPRSSTQASGPEPSIGSLSGSVGSQRASQPQPPQAAHHHTRPVRHAVSMTASAKMSQSQMAGSKAAAFARALSVRKTVSAAVISTVINPSSDSQVTTTAEAVGDQSYDPLSCPSSSTLALFAIDKSLGLDVYPLPESGGDTNSEAVVLEGSKSADQIMETLEEDVAASTSIGVQLTPLRRGRSQASEIQTRVEAGASDEKERPLKRQRSDKSDEVNDSDAALDAARDLAISDAVKDSIWWKWDNAAPSGTIMSPQMVGNGSIAAPSPPPAPSSTRRTSQQSVRRSSATSRTSNGASPSRVRSSENGDVPVPLQQSQFPVFFPTLPRWWPGAAGGITHASERANVVLSSALIPADSGARKSDTAKSVIAISAKEAGISESDAARLLGRRSPRKQKVSFGLVSQPKHETPDASGTEGMNARDPALLSTETIPAQVDTIVPVIDRDSMKMPRAVATLRSEAFDLVSDWTRRVQGFQEALLSVWSQLVLTTTDATVRAGHEQPHLPLFSVHFGSAANSKAANVMLFMSSHLLAQHHLPGLFTETEADTPVVSPSTVHIPSSVSASVRGSQATAPHTPVQSPTRLNRSRSAIAAARLPLSSPPGIASSHVNRNLAHLKQITEQPAHESGHVHKGDNMKMNFGISCLIARSTRTLRLRLLEESVRFRCPLDPFLILHDIMKDMGGSGGGEFESIVKSLMPSLEDIIWELLRQSNRDDVLKTLREGQPLHLDEQKRLPPDVVDAALFFWCRRYIRVLHAAGLLENIPGVVASGDAISSTKRRATRSAQPVMSSDSAFAHSAPVPGTFQHKVLHRLMRRLCLVRDQFTPSVTMQEESNGHAGTDNHRSPSRKKLHALRSGSNEKYDDSLATADILAAAKASRDTSAAAGTNSKSANEQELPILGNDADEETGNDPNHAILKARLGAVSNAATGASTFMSRLRGTELSATSLLCVDSLYHNGRLVQLLLESVCPIAPLVSIGNAQVPCEPSGPSSINVPPMSSTEGSVTHKISLSTFAVLGAGSNALVPSSPASKYLLDVPRIVAPQSFVNASMNRLSARLRMVPTSYIAAPTSFVEVQRANAARAAAAAAALSRHQVRQSIIYRYELEVTGSEILPGIVPRVAHALLGRLRSGRLAVQTAADDAATGPVRPSPFLYRMTTDGHPACGAFNEMLVRKAALPAAIPAKDWKRVPVACASLAAVTCVEAPLQPPVPVRRSHGTDSDEDTEEAAGPSPGREASKNGHLALTEPRFFLELT
jgi:hypothetical protein